MNFNTLIEEDMFYYVYMKFKNNREKYEFLKYQPCVVESWLKNTQMVPSPMKIHYYQFPYNCKEWNGVQLDHKWGPVGSQSKTDTNSI